MLLLESLPTVIGSAAVAPALLFLWLVIATDERPGPPIRVWSAFFYGAAAGLGFAAYENLAYLVQHPDIWRSLAALRSVLTVPFHGALGIIAGAYLAIARAGTALGANRHHRDWARLSSRLLILAGPLALHAGFDFPLLTLQQNPDL